MTMNDRSRRGARVSRVSWTGQTLRDWSIVPLRAIVGYGFIAHGLAKWHRGPEAFAQLLSLIGVPFPIATAWLVTLLETLGGLAILLGVFVAIASGPLIASMLVAMFSLHLRYGFSSVKTIGLNATGPIFGPPGYEINLLYIAALAALALSGPGPLSIAGFLAQYHDNRNEGHRHAG
jgi:putative oxidoreductase